MTSKQLTKRCARCGWQQVHFRDWWDGLEWASGKRRPAKHKGCGGEFLSPLTRGIGDR